MSFPQIQGYVVTEKLGSGSYATVYKAYTKVGGRATVAVKCIDKSRVKHSGAAVDSLVTEIRLLKTLAHPHIVHMKEFTWDDRNIYIIMEYCCGGDLSKYIQRYGRVPEKRVLYFLQQLASALKFLREKGVVHMDLKPHNLLLHKGSDGKYTLKVADFGFAQHLTEETKRSVRGSPLYMAPEMIAGHYDARVDLWSVGVIMYECLFGRAPYSSATFKELVDKIQRQDPIRIPPNSSISPGCQELLTRLLQHDPDLRISYEEFFNNEYLDLEHMPNKENYDKAVALVRRAVQLEARGALAGALAAYGAALRRLLPAAAAEGDALRRCALTAKLARYMERAEEIKAFLKAEQHQGIQTIQNTQEEHAPDEPAHARPSACCVGGEEGSSYDFGPLTQRCPCSCLSQQSKSGECVCTNGQEADGMETHSGESAPSLEGVTAVPRPRGGFARFLKRASMPHLDSKEDVADVLPDNKNTKATEDTSNDMCKIT